MGGVIDTIVGAIFGKPDDPPPQIAAPAPVETEAQKTQEDITKAEEVKAAKEAEARAKVISARAAGPQTLFKREGEIPKAVKLGGGRRE